MSYEDDARRARDLMTPLLKEVGELLALWQCHFDSGVRPDDDQPDEQRLWDRIESARKRCQS